MLLADRTIEGQPIEGSTVVVVLAPELPTIASRRTLVLAPTEPYVRIFAFIFAPQAAGAFCALADWVSSRGKRPHIYF
jgi:hypothetical protein